MKTLKNKSELHRYPIESSPLYRLGTKKKLAELLAIKSSEIRDLDKSKLDTQYNFFIDRKTRRLITQPTDSLEKIHRQLLKYLVRIAPPDYVHSAIKRRSYKTNANAHRSGGVVIKIDVKKFFPSVKYQCIHNFFSESLQCSPDVATILARLCVVKTEKYGVHLPTGSCISPVLSFLANKSMFDQIKKICDEWGCTFTLYVDDITISGPTAKAELLSLVATEIHKRGYKYHKTNLSAGDHALVTGLVVKKGRLLLPHKRAEKIRGLIRLLEVTVISKENVMASLIGRLSEAEQIEPKYKSMRLRVMNKHRLTWENIVRERTARGHTARRKLSGK